MRRRIVLATDSTDPSGMGEHMLTLGEGLSATFDVALVAPVANPDNGLLGRAASRGLRVKVLDPSRIDRFAAWLGNFGADLVHVHAGIGWEGHGIARAGKSVGLPVVRTEHLPYLLTDVVQQAEYRAMLLSVDCRIAVSRAVADSHADSGKGRLQVVPNGVAPRVASQTRAETRTALGIGKDDPVILTVARLAAQKGHDVLIAAIPTVLRSFPNAQFLIVGSGPEAGRLATIVADRGLDASALMLGSRADVPDLLASADLFVLPSEFEGLPLALLEAMAAALPVVATDIGGNVEALGRDHQLLVPFGDAAVLAETIIRALSDPSASEDIADTARARFATNFTADRMTRHTAALYQSLIGPEPQGAIA